MKCPLAAIGLLANGDKKVNEKCGCVKEECAWWVATEGRCAALSLTDRLTMLMLDLRKIREKMPHEEQFRR